MDLWAFARLGYETHFRTARTPQVCTCHVRGVGPQLPASKNSPQPSSISSLSQRISESTSRTVISSLFPMEMFQPDTAKEMACLAVKKARGTVIHTGLLPLRRTSRGLLTALSQ